MDVSPVAFQPASSGTAAASGSAGDSPLAAVQAAPVAAASTPVAGIQAPQAGQLAQALRQVNDTFTQRGQNLYAAFEQDKATGIDVVKIVDKNTKEVVSQMPSREIMAFAQFLEQSQGQSGQLVRVKA